MVDEPSGQDGPVSDGDEPQSVEFKPAHPLWRRFLSLVSAMGILRPEEWPVRRLVLFSITLGVLAVVSQCSAKVWPV